ncbi:MAG: hypothetical protein U0840_11260 [Gemmataceae bacterium]
MRSIAAALRDAQHHLAEVARVDLAPLFADEELLVRLALRLLTLARQGVPAERPLPHFSGECTPSLAEAFAPFAPALAAWHEQPDAPTVPLLLAQPLTADRALLLLGQRRTPASLADARAFPPLREKLLGSALAPYSPGDRISVAGRALAKHAPRSSGTYWGTITGSADEKNAAARQHLVRILDEATWWNVFGHYKHDTVFESRGPTGHGARWGHQGAEFIGFLEPFVEE